LACFVLFRRGYAWTAGIELPIELWNLFDPNRGPFIHYLPKTDIWHITFTYSIDIRQNDARDASGWNRYGEPSPPRYPIILTPDDDTPTVDIKKQD